MLQYVSHINPTFVAGENVANKSVVNRFGPSLECLVRYASGAIMIKNTLFFSFPARLGKGASYDGGSDSNVNFEDIVYYVF